ncbi:hypothetical protein BJF78_23795 [Pseudonocardia sp. CNS-139]|nr:hypothetical protein BJF78_23795 [Pseudonocardia sp. CNS-139]
MSGPVPGAVPGRRVVVDGTDVTAEPMELSIGTAAAQIFDVWATGGAGTPDGPPAGAWSLVPPDGGTVWRFAAFLPGQVGDDPRAGMHATPTVDYGLVLSGTIALVLADGREVPLRAGDAFVLRGAQHTWANHGDTTCVISFVLVHHPEAAEG